MSEVGLVGCVLRTIGPAVRGGAWYAPYRTAAVFAVVVGILAAGLSCPSRTATLTPASAPVAGDEELVLFFTGSELGSLRPCGCSGGQLGGIEKRSAVFDAVPASRRLVVATGGLVPSDGEQDLMKYRILFEAFKLLHYDVVRLTGRDQEIGARVGVLEDPPRVEGVPPSDRGQDARDTKPPFAVLQPGAQGGSAQLTRHLTVEGQDIIVNFAAFDSAASFLQAPSFAAQPQNAPTVSILMLQEYDPNALSYRSWRAPGVECIICPSNSDEPQLLSKPGETPLVFSVGRFGRYIVRLGVRIPPQDARQDAQGNSAHFKHQTSNIKLHFESIPVKEHLADDTALVQLLRQYKQLVSQSDLLERHPRLPLGNGLRFVGSASCRRCHAAEYDQWKTTEHSHALDTLKKVGSDRDPECVICHVSGLDYEGGFVNEQKTPHLAGVGCENCHGPGSEHVLTAGQAATTGPKTACVKCHTPEQSLEFAGHEEEFMKKIIHWTEPTAAGKVKE